MIRKYLIVLLLSQWVAAASMADSEQSLDEEMVALGQLLFEDVRLSRDGSLSCASCHNLSYAGADIRGISVGIGGEVLRRNAPSVYNAVFNFRQMWDGRARTLQEQVSVVMTSVAEMDTDWEKTTRLLQADPLVSVRFEQVFGEAVSKENVIEALAAFESTLVTLDTPYDRYLAGNENALDVIQRQGLELFRSLGCNSCHDGPHLGGNQFQHMALFFEFGSDHDLVQVGGESGMSYGEEHEDDHDEELGGYEQVDTGRFEVTRLEEDRLVFKVPNLRNVALTPPYFHNGSAATLEAAVYEMAEHQLGVLLNNQQLEQLVAFLKALSSDRLKGIEWHEK